MHSSLRIKPEKCVFVLEDDLLGNLRLSLQDWLLLSSETLLLHVVTSLSLGVEGFLTLLVLGNLMETVLL